LHKKLDPSFKVALQPITLPDRQRNSTIISSSILPPFYHPFRPFSPLEMQILTGILGGMSCANGQIPAKLQAVYFNWRSEEIDMQKQYQRRILRNYHNLPPSKFHAFNQRVKNGLSEHAHLPESAWAANPTLLSSYLSASDKHDALYHDAVHGSRLVISERDILQAQLVNYLDEIASVLEAAAIRNPELLLPAGFDLAKDQRNHSRAKVIVPGSDEAKVLNAE
jgi:hypothetical protein